MAVLIGKNAPDFKANAVINGGEFVKGFTLSQFAFIASLVRWNCP